MNADTGNGVRLCRVDIEVDSDELLGAGAFLGEHDEVGIRGFQHTFDFIAARLVVDRQFLIYAAKGHAFADEILDRGAIGTILRLLPGKKLTSHRRAGNLRLDRPGKNEHEQRKKSDLLDKHHALIRTDLARFRGREVKTTGDGILATFDGPARGVRCACALAEGVNPLGIEVRAGLHTGECEMMGDDVGGIAVHIGARVAALAGAGEVLVSSTVKDLVAGSGLRFGDRGIPGEWHIYTVER